MTIPEISASYEGRLDSKGDMIAGTFTQAIEGPLVLTRATPAKTIPGSVTPRRPMPADATLAFEVSAIRPAAPDRGLSIHVNPSGLLTTTNSSLLSGSGPSDQFAWFDIQK
jgi:hypothetical protein